ncbi:MAG TPA: GTPase, partial [Pirellulaceae bacterium]
MILASVRDISHSDWKALHELLARGPSCLVPESNRRQWLAEWEDVTQLEAHLDDALVIGLIGGTGVGKSTLINALAGAEVSRSGDRRPTTDKVVVYVHRDGEIPLDVPLADFAKPHVLHGEDRLSRIVLLDFPDFDSDERSHAEILGRHLPFLDVLLVVVDDMKYGDMRLYELLRGLGHAASNVFLILN